MGLGSWSGWVVYVNGFQFEFFISDGPGQVVLSGKTLWGCKLKNDRKSLNRK